MYAKNKLPPAIRLGGIVLAIHAWHDCESVNYHWIGVTDNRGKVLSGTRARTNKWLTLSLSFFFKHTRLLLHEIFYIRMRVNY
jgi:hypothetical protein